MAACPTSDAANLPELEAALRAHFPGAELRRAERLKGGVSADVYRLDLHGANGKDRSVVLRVMGKSGIDSALEYALLSALSEAGLPAPRPLHFDASGTLIAMPYVLMEYVAGSSAIPEARAKSHLALMAEALAAIHQTPTGPLPKLPLRLDPLPELLTFLPGGDDWQDVRGFCASLPASPYQGTPTLLHGDFWPQNLIWQGERIAGIIDWEDAALGDPLSDLACARLELSYLYDAAHVERFTAAYRAHLAADEARLALWQVYVASAGQHSMGNWRLEPSREGHMRRTALKHIREAAAFLMNRAV